jgi:tetratricopeptide (TPR) repeat protein
MIPVPVLSGDEVENERRVDLRIRKSSSFTSQSSQMGNSTHSTSMEKKNGVHSTGTAMLEDGVEPLSIQELRFDEERQDVNPLQGGSCIQRMKDNLNGKNMQLISNAKDASSLLPGQHQDEIRFSMSNFASKQQQQLTPDSTTSPMSSHHRNSSSNNNVTHPDGTSNGDVRVTTPKVRTCPVDVDKGTFLEAEKNLQAIHEMASEHLRQGECAEALEVFEEILRGQLARFGPDHYRVGTALHNIGIVHMRQKDFVRALAVYKEAVRIRKKTLSPCHPDVAASLAQLGVAYMEREKYRKAIGAFREALKIRRICLGNDHPKVAKILNNIGCSLFELNELEVAMVAFEEALDIQRNLLRNPIDGCPVTESSLLSIASTQSNIASIKLYCGHFDEALIDLEEALLIQQCALGDDHPLARRTQESIRWMEMARQKNKPTAVSVDLLTHLTGDSMSSTIASATNALSASKSRSLKSTTMDEKPTQSRRMMLSSNMFDALLARLDLACGGWDPAEELDHDNGSYHSGETESDQSSIE